MTRDENLQKLNDLKQRSDTVRRRFHARRPKAIGDVVAQLIAKQGYGAVETDRQLQEAWNNSVGPALARFTRAGRINRGRLEATVANSAVMQELTFDKTRILAAVQQAMPEAKITDLRLRVGKIK